MGGIIERHKELAKRRHRKKKLKVLKRRLAKGTPSEKAHVVAKIRRLTPGRKSSLPAWARKAEVTTTFVYCHLVRVFQERGQAAGRVGGASVAAAAPLKLRGDMLVVSLSSFRQLIASGTLGEFARDFLSPSPNEIPVDNRGKARRASAASRVRAVSSKLAA
jgi:hypothetical protein